MGISRLAAILFGSALLSMESLQHGSMVSAILGSTGLVLVGIATVGRLWCSLYVSGYKNRRLVTAGPYSLTRNPLYVFSLLGFVGIGCTTETVSVPIIFLVLFATVYPFVIADEERFLRGMFGADFESYCARTPRFFPRMSGLHEPASYVVDPKRIRRALLDAVWFVWAVGAVELLEALNAHGYLRPLFRLP